MRAISNRAIATTTALAIALTTTGIPAFAASNPDKIAQAKQATVTDMSAAKKRHRGRHGIDPAGRAMLGMVGGVFGIVAAAAARDAYRQRYYPNGYYGYYGGGYGYPYAYQPRPYYYGYPY